MDSEHVVEVEVQGFAVEGQVAVDGHRLDADEAEAANDEKVAILTDNETVDLLDVLVREDGTGIVYFRWVPPGENVDGERLDDAADTWHSAKAYTEHIISTVVGAGLLRVEHRIGTRAVSVEVDEAE